MADDHEAVENDTPNDDSSMADYEYGDDDINIPEDEMLIVITIIDDRTSQSPKKINRQEFQVMRVDLNTEESSRKLITKIINHLYVQFPTNLKAKTGIIDFMVNYVCLLSGEVDCIYLYVLTLYSFCYNIASTEERNEDMDMRTYKVDMYLQAYQFLHSDDGKQLRSITDVKNEEIEPPVYSSVYDYVYNLPNDDDDEEFDPPIRSRCNPEAELGYFIKCYPL